ncbi:DUF6542 domain-containing protein [Lentzea sp. NBRC 102530]|uniref:DUF6542 domain-containing protein n=1 Tax=Lentzea sp. NBRC 102530 TaxID=3032201 RepID=UPI0024A0D4B9|nr:DUF6542 domain-containing protein [Lentzea sp. NBRC 102530]GLY53654.1 hypothetical protein Lesp01_73100 [Lentzea sp. NBRC 102530]
MGVQLPSLAAVAMLAVFTQTGIWVDDGFGWGFGGWFVGGALAVSALVRMVGLWTVVPVPPLVFVVVAVGNAGWERQSRRLAWWGSTRELGADAVPLLVHGFPWMAAAVGAALVVAAVRVFSRGRRKCRSSSTAVAVDG